MPPRGRDKLGAVGIRCAVLENESMNSTLSRSSYLIALSAVVGVAVIGMLTGQPILQSFLAGRVGMKPLTAALFVVIILGLAAEARRIHRLAAGAGLIVLGFGLTGASEYLLGVDFGTGRLMGPDFLRLETVMPGRMAPATAIAFVAIGVLLLLRGHSAAVIRTRRLLIATVLLISVSVLIGFVYGAREFRGMSSATPMALPTALALLLSALAAGKLFCEHEWPWTLWEGEGTTVTLSRFLIPTVILIPIIAGAVRLAGEAHGWFGRELGTALMVLFHIVALIGVLLWALTRLQRSEGQHEAYGEELRQRDAELTEVIRKLNQQTRNFEEAQTVAGLGSWQWDVLHDHVQWSPELHRVFGTPPGMLEPSFEGYLAHVHPEDCERVERAVRESLNTREPFALEHRLLRLDGTEGVINSRGNVESDSSGTVIRVYGIAHDITASRAAEAELQRSEERFELASQATSDVIWDWNLVTNGLWINDGWTKQFGYPQAGDIALSDWSEAMHPEDHDGVLAEIKRVFESTENVWAGEYRLRTYGGEYREILDRGFVIRDRAGKTLRMIGAMMDITDRKQAEISIKLLHRTTELILKSAADGLFGMDLDGVNTFVNPAAAHILGYEPDELEGKQMHATIHDRHEDGSSFPWQECPAAQTIADGAGRSSTGVFWSKMGRAIPVDFSATAMVDERGAVTGAVMTFRDISERHAVDRMKDEFVSTVSHELRTPLTSIRGALGLLVSGRLGVMPEKAARLLEIASTNADRLVRLINDILDIERMESGKVTLNKAPADAAELVRQATDMMQQLASESGVTIIVEAKPLPLIADADRIVQTLTNLIGNAVKFSPPKSIIRVSTQATADGVMFQVEDQGRGIPRDKLQSVFERFKQVDASDSREKGGSGLGLAICRSIVRQHGGEISVASDVGVGSVFSFNVPVPSTSTVPVSEAAARHQPLVFVCDDEEGARDVISVLLSAHGYRVVEFSGSEALISRAEHERPDLILLDIFMPDMNGWETLSRFKTDERLANIPIMIVSGLSPEECSSPFPAMHGWLQKPFEEAGLIDAVTEALGSGVHPRRLLLVEDDADLARVIASSVERHGLEVIIASTGRQAIDLSATLVPDLVVLDLLLPEVDGFGVVDSIKDHDRWRGVPLIVYSALETTPSQQERLRLGPTEFITKSRIAPEEFERRVLHLLDRITRQKP